jgi:DNA-directed RNA polymerase specialized sigma24 family protein
MEFSEYVAARRGTLVRSAVLLGCPQADAEDIVQATLLKAYRSWRRVTRADRPDAYVYRILPGTARLTHRPDLHRFRMTPP